MHFYIILNLINIVNKFFLKEMNKKRKKEGHEI